VDGDAVVLPDALGDGEAVNDREIDVEAVEVSEIVLQPELELVAEREGLSEKLPETEKGWDGVSEELLVTEGKGLEERE
jgi:hypothetical protein